MIETISLILAGAIPAAGYVAWRMKAPAQTWGEVFAQLGPIWRPNQQ